MGTLLPKDDIISVAQSIGKYRHLVNLTLELAFGSKSTTVAVGIPDKKQNICKTGEECECVELHLGG